MNTRDEILKILNDYHQAEKNADSGTVVNLLPYAKRLEKLITKAKRAKS